MKDTLKYKGFIGSVRFSAVDKVFHGKIEGIGDLVTFEGKSVDELVRAFHEAVEDYLELCREAKKAPHKSYKGSFNVRVSPDVHEKAAAKAKEMGISLNKFVQTAIEHEVAKKNDRDRVSR
jgi:predicted HicB family RNase H-like nuclease